jgi:hypothetical protein
MARQDCKTALGLRDEQAQRSAKQKGWRLNKHKHRLFLADGDVLMRLIIQKRRKLYEGIERSRSLTKNNNDLASYNKTRTGFRH